MFTHWLTKYFNNQITVYGCIKSVNYLAKGLPRNWAIRKGKFVNLDEV